MLHIQPSPRGRTDPSNTGRGTRRDAAFTLIELLIVIVILGILAVVVVFAVRGVTDQGNDSARATDARTLVTAQESYQARFGSYSDESGLVAVGLLRSESDLHDITLSAGDYTLTYLGDGGGGGGGGGPVVAPPVAATFAGFNGLQYGSGATTYVLLPAGLADLAGDWNGYTSAPCDPGSTLFFVTDAMVPGHLDTIAGDPAFSLFLTNTAAGTTEANHINFVGYPTIEWGPFGNSLDGIFGGCGP